MRTRISCRFSIAAAALVLLPLAAFAEEQYSGSISAGANAYLGDGRRDSAKFEEYRDVPSGPVGSAELNYKNDTGYHAQASAENVAQHDQEYSLSSGKYNQYNIQLEMDNLPHRYAFDAKSLYSGVGTDDLQFNPQVRDELQHATSLNQIGTILNKAESNAEDFDLMVERSKKKASLSVDALDPVKLKVEVAQEDREGNRPIGMGFGFGNAIEIIEPRDYKTTDYKAALEYGTKEVFGSVAYAASFFQNEIGGVTWDNPFRTSDSTSPSAYTNPSGSGSSFANEGPAQGFYEQAPDNYYQSITATGVLKELPLQSRLAGTVSFGWMRQDEELAPYTTNTAIGPRTPGSASFDATSPSNLPINSADAAVNTSLYNLVLTSRPISFMDIKARYRFYERDNQTDTYEFPGYARFDSSWQDQSIHTDPIGYKKHTASLDFGFDVYEQTKLGLGYTFQQMERDHREVSTSDENALKVSLDNSTVEWLNLQTSFEHSDRSVNGNYDPTAPFDGEVPNSQLPFLRRYDEASRKRDAISLLGTVTPGEKYDFTASYTFARSDYDDSDFGLKDDTQHVISLDADYNVTQRSKIYGFYSFERHRSNQLDRQWSPNGLGDPYTVETTTASNSNWDAKITDTVHTVGAGVDISLIADKLSFKATYSLSDANGKVDLGSPLGTSRDDANAFEPANFTESDDVIIHTLNPKLVYAFSKTLTATLGYMWEKYDVSDYNKDLPKAATTTTSGAYNGGLLMDTLPYNNYEVNLGYVRVDYKF